MILIPLEPKAGPTGGEGLAAPPLICNFSCPAISLAIVLIVFIEFKNVLEQSRHVTFLTRLLSLYLRIIQLKRSFTPEHLHHHLELAFLAVNLVDAPYEAVKRPIVHFHGLSHDKVA